MMRAVLTAVAALALGLTLSGLPAGAQQPPRTAPPAPVEAAPLPPPAATPQPPPAPDVQAAPPAAIPPTRFTAAGRPTLVPNPGDPADVNEVTLPSKPAAVLAGTSTWDEGFANLQNAQRRIEEELVRAAITPAGKPLTVFLETDDLGFRYEAMAPIAAVPAGRLSLTPEVRFGRTPEGKALRFVHKGAYEEIDETYETITAYLDAKGVTVQDSFIEEYVTDLTDPTDVGLEINIFVLPK